MTPREFFNRFIDACKRYGHSPERVWANCEIDEHQALIDELPGEWDNLEQCLKSWQRPSMDWQHINPIPMPVVHCQSCKHYLDNFCGLFQKDIPANFDQANACKRWNE